MPSASLASRASARKSTARMPHLIFFWRSARLREVQGLLQGKQRQVPLLRRGLERERLLQEEPIYWRLREVQGLLQGKQRQVPPLRRGLERERLLQEEPIYR